mgnify:CR=1 FL=1
MILTRGNSPRCVTTGSVSRNVNLGGERVDAWRAIHSLGAVHVTEKSWRGVPSAATGTI